MKKIVAVLLTTFCVSAQADVLAYINNKGGGRIVFTDEQCVVNGKRYDNLRRMYGFTKDGTSSDGCWAIEHEMVVAVWEDGTKYRYTPDMLVTVNRGKGSNL